MRLTRGSTADNAEQHRTSPLAAAAAGDAQPPADWFFIIGRSERPRRLRSSQQGDSSRPDRWLQSLGVDFELVGSLTDTETIAAGRGIRDRTRLRRLYGKGYWRKMKGTARIKLRNGKIRLAEIHWYEAHGIGKKELKRKRYLD
jgi:hypothetical protein